MNIDPNDTDAIDRAVAEARGGFTEQLDNSFWYPSTMTLGGEFVCGTQYSPATDHKQAAELREEMGSGRLMTLDSREDTGWIVVNIRDDHDLLVASAQAPTVQAAICLCWLAWKEGQG